MPVEIVVAVVAGVLVGGGLNRLIHREPGYVVSDPRDLPDDADEALLDELLPPPDVSDLPRLALVQPRSWRSRPSLVLVELLAGAGLAATVARFDRWEGRVTVGFLVLALLVLAAIDLRVYRLPDRINRPAAAIGLLLIVVASVALDEPGLIVGAVFGGVAYALVLFLAHLAYPRGMGWGDVKLAWLLGFYLGWLGWRDGSLAIQLLYSFRYVLYGAGVGSLLGALIGIPYAVVKRSTSASFPYGPALAIGCLVIVFFGRDLVA